MLQTTSGLHMRFLSLKFAVFIFLLFAALASRSAEWDTCKGVPESLSDRISENPSGFYLSSRSRWNDDGEIESTLILREESTCLNGSCMHHFFVGSHLGRNCEIVFSSRMPIASTITSSIITNSSDETLAAQQYHMCDVFFRGHCYQGERDDR